MAQQVKVLLIDDLDGSDADETVKFGLDGRDYEMDLTSDHAAELREVLSRYVSVSRKLSKLGAPMKKTIIAPQRDNRAVREWANANGYSVSDRGRIPEDIVEAYDHRNDKAPEAPKAPEFSSEGQEEEPKKAPRRRAKKPEPANA